MSDTAVSKFEIPAPLIEQIRSGDVVLFLGAGSNDGAAHPNGELIPTHSSQLRDYLCEQFFQCELRDRSLLDVSKFAESEYGLPRLQEAIVTKFDSFEPAQHHLTVPLYPWHAIATTNYDRITEKSYERANTPFNLIPFYKNDDGLDRKLKAANNAVPFLKLHGCISQATDLSIPLILTPEQYIRYQKNRSRLYEALRGWAQDFVLLFVGYSISDPHIAQIILDLEDEDISRMRY